MYTKSLCLLAAVAMTFLAGAAPAAENPILDVESAPHLSASCRTFYADYLLLSLPRAFAVSPNGRCARTSGGKPEEVRARALQLCAKGAGTDCALYAADLEAMWPGAPAFPKQVVPGPFLKTSSYEFTPDDRFIWRGPAAARGVLVWGHGYGGDGADYRGLQPPPIVRAFNNAGFDVVRFDRAPSNDYPENARGWLADGLAQLRKLGYRSIISGGQSRGGFDATWMLRKPGLVNGILTLGSSGYGQKLQPEVNLAIMLANAPNARVVMALFADDPYEAKDLAGRARELRASLAPKVGAVMIFDRPPGFSGHFAGLGLPFAVKFGACTVRFMTEPGAPPCQDISPPAN